ncbi:hypothetical protein Scep_027716 [Stephania cephalantha]|uniref:Uncharacterized protein n=1 Tax=Stephania cephalantha TaxID=152367 RepID=A0AAP0HIS3_9MAGN
MGSRDAGAWTVGERDGSPAQQRGSGGGGDAAADADGQATTAWRRSGGGGGERRRWTRGNVGAVARCRPIDPRRDNNGGQGFVTSTKLDDAMDSNGF